MTRPERTWLVLVFGALGVGLGGCPPLEQDDKPPIAAPGKPGAADGAACDGDAKCKSAFCHEGTCMDPDGDADGDGLSNAIEAQLGLDVASADTDGDGLADGVEVGSDVSAPLDGDADGKIDALESHTADADGDCLVDALDADDAAPADAGVVAQVACVAPGHCASVDEVEGVTCAPDAQGVVVVSCECAAACEPDCADKACGDDGCGGSCGGCDDGNPCTADVCQDAGCVAEAVADGTECGEGDVCEAGACVPPCTPSCEGVACGDDGCGGSCGACDDGNPCTADACEAGVCQAEAVEDGTACGDGDVCEAGACVPPCTPSCEGVACGDDGCGGSCGECDDGNPCTADACEAGVCQAEAVEDGTACLDGWICEAGVCVEPCVPSCDGKECGDDGCGGSCGGCDDGSVCTADACGEDGQCVHDVIASCCSELVYDCPLEQGFACTLEGTCEKGNLVYVPAGPFVMGCDGAPEGGCQSLAVAAHEVDVPAFVIHRREVTTQEYKNCWWDTESDAPCIAPVNQAFCNYVESRWTHPMNCVSWAQAEAYCAWAGGRLCTEAEWEKAARGTDERPYPWGDTEATCDYAHMHGCGTLWTVPPGSKLLGDSPYGAIDMAGNVSEWVQDCLTSSYDGAPTDGSAWDDPECVQRVHRGGSYTDQNPVAVQTFWRHFDWVDPVSHPNAAGIRCCFDLEAP